MANKILPFDVALKEINPIRSFDCPKVYTNDLNSVEFQFTLTDMSEAELVGATANVVLYMRDKSFFQNTPATGVTLDGNVVKYLMKENEGNHAGKAQVQVEIVYADPDKVLSSKKYDFEIINGLEMEVAVEVIIQDWSTLVADATEYIEAANAAEAIRLQSEIDRVAAENIRLTNDIDRPIYHYVTQAEYDALTIEEQNDPKHIYEVTDSDGEVLDELTGFITGMQTQFDNAISGTTVDSETINARVDKSNVVHQTLKKRLDNDKSITEQSLVSLSNQLEQMTYLNTEGIDKTGAVDCTTKLNNAIANAGSIIRIPKGTYKASNVNFPDNVVVIFDNVIFTRSSGGTNSFLLFGENCSISGSAEIIGNKELYTANQFYSGLRLGENCISTAKIYSHENAGHGISLSDGCVIYDPISNDNGLNPNADGSGSGDGIYLVNRSRVKIFNPITTGNTRNGISVTTYNSVTGLPDVTLMDDVLIENPYSIDNIYVDVDVEGANNTKIIAMRGYGTLYNSVSYGCTFEDIEAKTFYADECDNVDVKNVKLKPQGAASNVFYVSGKNPKVKQVYIFNTATSYNTNTFQVIDGVNSNAQVEDITVEKGLNGVVITGCKFAGKIKVISAANIPINIDSRRLMSNNFTIENGVLTAYFNKRPSTGWGMDGGSYTQGDRVVNTQPQELGATGSKYVVTGYVCVLTGVNALANWLELRMLTGS